MAHPIDSNDIFISYKNDGSGNQFANRLVEDLRRIGYSVYFNPHAPTTQHFPEKLAQAVAHCTDFILVVSRGCLEQLIHNNPIDWVREEILTARKHGKRIIPILIEGVDFPADINVFPKALRFLPKIDGIHFSEQYLSSSFSFLLAALVSKKDNHQLYRQEFNNNPSFRVQHEFNDALAKALSGSVESMYEIGMMYYYGVTNSEGTISQQDYVQAAHWLQKVAVSANDLRYHAMSTLARMYYQGTMPQEPQSYQKSYDLHSAAAEKDNFSAGERGYMLRKGVGCEYNYQEILNHYKENNQKDSDFALARFALFFTNHGRFKEALEIYNLMDHFSPDAYYQLGLLYRDGVISDPPHPDPFRAAYYFQRAADEYHLQAAYEYGLLCFRPIGNEKGMKDFRSAEKYFKMAADGGHAEAQYVLGYMYKSGHLVQDLTKALEYLEMAKKQGHSYSALELSLLYQHPECQNYQKAYECAEMAASHGVAEAELILGNFLLWGRGCKYNIHKAYEMYQRAYRHGLYYAYVMMQKIDQLN